MFVTAQSCGILYTSKQSFSERSASWSRSLYKKTEMPKLAQFCLYQKMSENKVILKLKNSGTSLFVHFLIRAKMSELGRFRGKYLHMHFDWPHYPAVHCTD
jgi:hypothetical protein